MDQKTIVLDLHMKLCSRLCEKKSGGISCREFIRAAGPHSSHFGGHPEWDIRRGFSQVNETIAAMHWHEWRVCRMNQIWSIHHNQFYSVGWCNTLLCSILLCHTILCVMIASEQDDRVQSSVGNFTMGIYNRSMQLISWLNWRDMRGRGVGKYPDGWSKSINVTRSILAPSQL
jgi:hypothetical protein